MAKRCHCACHEYPGTYPTNEGRPCGVCGHIHSEGYMPGTVRDGWVSYVDEERGLRKIRAGLLLRTHGYGDMAELLESVDA